MENNIETQILNLLAEVVGKLDYNQTGLTDFGTWLHDFGDREYRLWYRDENANDEASHVRIINAIEVPGDILLELRFNPWDDDTGKEYREFELLSKVKLAYSKSDNTPEE
jgi:hypothetical protein